MMNKRKLMIRVPMRYWNLAAAHLQVNNVACRRMYRYSTETPLDCQPVPRTAAPSFAKDLDLQKWIASSVKPYYESQTPVVLQNASQVLHTPALQSWSSRDYLRQTVGNVEMAQVEIGGSYATPGVERPEIPLEDYLYYLDMLEEKHGSKGHLHDGWPGHCDNLPSKEEMVYLAQNELPSALQNDVLLPALCHDDSYGVGHGRMYQVMWWLGPRGSVSPLHYDPLDNFFLQILGRKRILLFDPKANASQWHYAGSQNQQSNTSPLDLEGPPSRNEYPLFWEHAPLPAYQAIVEPGDILYIPAKWWHHVRSIDTSASVNVWWR